MTGHLLLIDSSGFAYRSFYSAHPHYRESDGQPIGAVLGFASLLWRLLGAAQADPPTHVAAVFDAPGKTFRHRMFANYKSNRTLARARQEELRAQLPLMRHAAECLGAVSVELKGYEADDVIATLAERGRARSMRITIVSSDKDMMQLVADDEIEMVDPVAGRRVLAAEVRAKFGVDPAKVTDVQALAGDAADGIPGVKGVGLKRAAALVRRFGSAEAILREVHKPGCLIFSPAIAALLRRKQTQADVRLYKRVATLRRNAPVKEEIESLAVREVQKAHLMELLRALEASEKFEAMFEQTPRTFRLLDRADPNEFAWWKRASAGERGPAPNAPQCGWYRRRLVRGGPWVPARIWTEPDIDFAGGKPSGSRLLLCELGGERKDAFRLWDSLCGHPITGLEYDHMVKVKNWARTHAPSEPEANPEQPINWNRIAI